MEDRFSRTNMLLGDESMERLSRARVAVFGIGGVGGYVCEALVRSGIGHFDIIDNDTVSITNLNRQIIAVTDTVGRYKTDVMRERMLSINPDADIRVHTCFFLPENADEFDFSAYDYVADCVDTVTAKISLIMKAQDAGVPVISAMGAGNKLDASRFRVADIYDTQICPLARVMRRELKKRGVKSLKVVYSDEPPVKTVYENAENAGNPDKCTGENRSGAETRPVSGRPVPASIAFTPAAAGLIMAGEIVKDLAGLGKEV